MLNRKLQPLGADSGAAIVKRFPFFYGWVILAAGSLGLIMSSPGQTYTISIFIDFFIADLNISRGMVSTYYMIGTLTASLGLPFIGKMIDRRGPRIMVGMISIALGLTCIYMGFITYGVMLLIGFILLRFFGQGSISLVSTYVINQWWVRRRGSILGISGVMIALFGMAGFPNLVNWLIPMIGWRYTYAVLGLAILLIMAPVGYVFYRSRPELFGLLPDNTDEMQDAVNQDNAPLIEENWTLEEVRRTSVFWILSAGLASISMLGTGLTFHMVSIFADSNLSSTIAAAVYVPIAITSAVSNLVSGILVDRIAVRYMQSVSLLLLVIALWMAPALTSVAVAALFGVVLGTMMGLQRTVGTVVWPAYFGRLHLGAITGFAATIGVASSALGPMPMGIARDLLGSYTLTLAILSILPLSLAVISLFIRPPRRALHDDVVDRKDREHDALK